MITVFKRNIHAFHLCFFAALVLSGFLFFMGFIRLIDTETRNAAMITMPYMILYSCILVFLFSLGTLKARDSIVFLIIAVLCYLIEVAGVNTGIIFGLYYYGHNLGIKLVSTPLIIGLNWLFLVYASASVLENFAIPAWLKILFASAIMLTYDIILEQLAPVLDMWYWHSGNVPLQNYIVWFLMAVLFHFILKWFGVNAKNKIAPFILSIQFVFFIALLIYI